MDSGKGRGQEGGGMTTNPEYSTKDLNLAVVLKLSGISLIRVENFSGKGVFVFKNSQKVEAIISDYLNDLTTMNPRAVFDMWKSLKSQAYTASNSIR